MAKHLQRDASGHLLKRGEADDHLANGCALGCDACEGHGPITCTITATGSCLTDGDCTDECGNAVFDLDWSVANNWWHGATDETQWEVFVRCEDDVWYVDITGGCWDFLEAGTLWNLTFTPEGCVTSGGNGYPTHSGIVMGTPDIEICYVDCTATVALS